MSLGAHHIGPTALLEVGCEVRSSSRRDADDYPIGGLIIWTENGAPDPGTGEIPTRYVVLDPTNVRLEFRTLEQDEIDPSLTLPPANSRMAKLIRRLDEAVAKSKSTFTPEHERYQRAAGVLMAYIFGAR